MLSLSDFEAKYTGQPNVGNTPQNIGECVGLVEMWTDNLNIPHEWANAIDLLVKADPLYFAIIENTPTNAPSPGDIAVLGAPYGYAGQDEKNNPIYFGHTGIVHSADINKLTLFQQNDPKESTPHLQDYNYRACAGWLHPLTLSPTVNQAANDAQLQDQLNKQIQATGACQTQLASMQEQNTRLQQQMNALQNELTDVTSKYNADERTIINIKTQLSLVNQEDTDFAVKAFENEKLATGYKNALVDLAKTAGIDEGTPQEQLVPLIKKKLTVIQTPPEPEVTTTIPVPANAAASQRWEKIFQLFLRK